MFKYLSVKELPYQMYSTISTGQIQNKLLLLFAQNRTVFTVTPCVCSQKHAHFSPRIWAIN